MSQSHQSTVIFLMGPTAAGKTQLAVDLVQQYPCEIISVDSAMIYRGMNIGTAKPDAETLKKAPHHLLDICNPAEAYSAAQFCADANRIIEDIIARQKIPLLVGGTMMYFRALLKGLAELPAADEAARAEITAEANQAGWPVLHERLAQIDPEAARRIHPNDSQRIQRALEVYKLTGKSLTSWQQLGATPLSQYHIINLAVAPADRAVLHERIEQRFKQMLEQGFVEEVRGLHARGDLNLEMPSMRSVGYRQIWEFLEGRSTLEEAQDQGIIATRQLAKRQLTWLRNWSQEIEWFNSLDQDLFNEVRRFLR